MASVDAVGIEQGDEFEDKVLPQSLSALVVWPQQEVEEAIEDVAGGRLTWMDSTGQKEHLK